MASKRLTRGRAGAELGRTRDVLIVFTEIPCDVVLIAVLHSTPFIEPALTVSVEIDIVQDVKFILADMAHG